MGPRGPGGGLAVAWRWPWRRPLSTPEPSLTTNGRVGCEFGRATWTTSVRGSASASTTVYREPSQSRHPSRALSGQGGGGGDLLRRRTAGTGGGGCRVPDSPAPRLPESPETQRQARATGDAAGDARNGNAAGDARNGRRSGRRTQRRRSGRRREEPRRSGQRSGEEREEEEPGEEQRREHPSPAGLRAGNASGTAWMPLWDALETALEHLVGSLHWGGSSRGSCAGPCRGFFLRCAHTFDQRTMPGALRWDATEAISRVHGGDGEGRGREGGLRRYGNNDKLRHASPRCCTQPSVSERPRVAVLPRAADDHERVMHWTSMSSTPTFT